MSHLATETFTTEEELAEQFFTFQCKALTVTTDLTLTTSSYINVPNPNSDLVTEMPWA